MGGEGAPHRDQQWTPRNDRYHGLDLGLQGLAGARTRQPWYQAVCWRDHGAILRWRCLAPFRRRHAKDVAPVLIASAESSSLGQGISLAVNSPKADSLFQRGVKWTT